MRLKLRQEIQRGWNTASNSNLLSLVETDMSMADLTSLGCIEKCRLQSEATADGKCQLYLRNMLFIFHFLHTMHVQYNTVGAINGMNKVDQLQQDWRSYIGGKHAIIICSLEILLTLLTAMQHD